MAELLVIGSVALDSVETPFGSVEDALGGSATYFSAAASLLTEVRVVAVVGEDFPEDHLDTLRGRGIDLKGLRREPGRTFRWSGRYVDDLNQAVTLDTQLNVFETFDPELPDSYKDSPYVFLANLHPALQLKVLEQTSADAFTGADTMNYWIDGERKLLEEVFRRVDCVTINEAEALEFSGESNIFRAVRTIGELGPEFIVVKRGAYGAVLCHQEEIFFIPAFPLEEVIDPTGAGDTFAGGLFGYLAAHDRHQTDDLRRGLMVGSVLASYNVEAFSLGRLLAISREDILNRAGQFERMIHIGDEGLVL
ncbi:PfkB family carbohydrate kinase [Gemmatimonadota bacterium]